jgi:multiple antibiotic resistance protein
VPIFLALTASHSPRDRVVLVARGRGHRLHRARGLGAARRHILTLVGASLAAFAVGGGLVLLLMALAMLNAQAGGVRQSEAEAAELESGELRGVVPLAIPLLAAPARSAPTIIAAEKGTGVVHLSVILGCIAAVSLLTWVVLRAANAIGDRFGTTGLNYRHAAARPAARRARHPDDGRRPQRAFSRPFLEIHSSIARHIASGCSVGIQCSASDLDELGVRQRR